MQVKIGSAVLATDSSRVVGTPGMPAGLENSCASPAQESNPIRAARRVLYARDNQAGSWSFTVRTEYATLGLSGAAFRDVPRAHAGLHGVLSVKSRGGSEVQISGAHVERCTARLEGHTVLFNYQIEY